MGRARDRSLWSKENTGQDAAGNRHTESHTCAKPTTEIYTQDNKEYPVVGVLQNRALLISCTPTLLGLSALSNMLRGKKGKKGEISEHTCHSASKVARGTSASSHCT